jgi:hypothetical protein
MVRQAPTQPHQPHHSTLAALTISTNYLPTISLKPTSRLVQTSRPDSMAKPHFLSGDKPAIEEFLSRFDVSLRSLTLLWSMLTNRQRSSSLTAMVYTHIFYIPCSLRKMSTFCATARGNELIVKKDRRPLVGRSPI